jgi:hypothetical protein
MSAIIHKITTLIVDAGVQPRYVSVQKAPAYFGENAYHVTIYRNAVKVDGHDYPRVSEQDKEIVAKAEKALFERFEKDSETEYFRDGPFGIYQIYISANP